MSSEANHARIPEFEDSEERYKYTRSETCRKES